MSHVFGRNTRVNPPLVKGGKGVYLHDNTGKRYLDACGGAAVSCFGHGNTAIIEAVKNQLDNIAYAHTSFFTSEPAENLASRLCDAAPEGIDRVYFVSGGSEAIEASIKLARQYHVERGDQTRTEIIARRQSYHGNTLGALSTGGNLWRRRQFEPLLSPAMHHIDPCYFWRWGQPGESAYDYGQRVAHQLEEKIVELGSENVAAFVAEPVVGATLGAVTAEKGYFKTVREICNRHGVLLILDEVMCGMGRTGHLFASAAEEIVPDIVCVAKGISAGVQPLGAMLCQSSIFQTIENGSGFFQHGHTNLAHPSACAAGCAVLDELQRQHPESGINLVDSVRQRGTLLIDSIRQVFGNHPNVGDVRGRGFFIGIELVADRQTKEPLDAELKTHARVKKRAFENGLLVYPMGGTVDGQSGDHVLMAPPFISSDDELSEMSELLVRTVNEVLPV